MKRFIDKLIQVLLFDWLVLMAVLLFVGAPWAAVEAYQEAHAETFSLRKGEWHCTATHIETSSAKTIHHEYVVCDQWTKD